MATTGGARIARLLARMASKPAHVLDAATYIAAAWDAVTPATIKSAYTKADIGVAFEDSQLRASDDVDTAITSLVASFASASIEETLEYVYVDDRDSEQYISEVVAEIRILICNKNN